MTRPPRAVAVALALLSTSSAIAGASAATVDAAPLRFAGSDTMVSLVEALAGAYAAEHPGFRYEVDGRGSATAPPLLLRGDAEIAAMTRALTALEERAFAARYGRQPVRVAIAVDAVAVVVGASNPIARLSPEQVDAIFGATRRCGGRGREIHTWGEAGAAGWTDRPIGVVVTPRTSGTREYFTEHALCGGEIVGTARELPGEQSVLRALVESPESVGYASRAVLTGDVKAVPLEGRFGRLYSATSYDDVRSGRYPLTRFLQLYALGDTDGRLRGRVADFLAFVLSEPGQRIVEEHGLLRLTADDATAQRGQLDVAGGDG